MVKFLINRPVAVFMAAFAFLLLGVVASLRIPTSLLPDIAIPEITVQLSYPNSTAREIETNITRPLRNQLLQVAHLEEIETKTRDGFATLQLHFEHGTDIDLAFMETNQKVDAALNYLPRDLERPRVIKASVTDIPILYLTVSLKGDYSGERFLQLSEFSETVLKKRIEQLPDIALADISGQAEPEISVTPKKYKLRSLNISNQALIDAIERNNFELGNLLVQDGVYQYNFKFSNPLQTVNDIESIYLNIHERLFRLGELADVTLRTQQQRGLVYSNGQRAIVLAIIKQADARVYELKETLNKLVANFKKEYPDLQFSTNQDQSKLLKLSIDNLKSSLWIGGILAILIMFFFLNDLKSPLIIAISVPVALVVSIFLMFLFGLSINIISLSGLILGVGMMIDNSIIVIDNISQKLEKGLPLGKACTQGTNEIITPLISSVLTTCSVFLPLVFLSGITGALFYDQALAVSIGLGSSLLVSILLIPVVYKQVKNKKFKLEKWFSKKNKDKKIEDFYENGLVFFFKHKWVVYGISLLSLVAAVILFNVMEYSQLPEIKRNEIVLEVDWNENITVFENQARTESLFEKTSGVEAHFVQAGEQEFLLQQENVQSFSEAKIYLKTDSQNKLLDIQNAIRSKFNSTYPKAKYNFNPPKTIFEYIFGGEEEKLIAEVYSKNSIEAPPEKELPGIKKLLKSQTATEIPLKTTTTIQILHEKVMLYNVDYDKLVVELKTAFDENFIDNLKTAERFIPIKLNYPASGLEESINGLFVRNENDKLIPVKNLIETKRVQKYKTLTADRGGEYLKFGLQAKDEIQGQIATIQKSFSENANFYVRFDGSWITLKNNAGELFGVIAVALFLLYFIMAAQFESLWQPLVILLEIPINIGAGLFLLWLFGETINIMAAIGIVVMSGVVVNDSILKLHTINMLRKEGHKVKDAVFIGGKLRFKSIVMTALTTILALLPFLFIGGLGAELQKPLALVVIGGLLLGTFISLYFIPIVYYAFSKK